MPKRVKEPSRNRKRPRDVNQLGAYLVQLSTEESGATPEAADQPVTDKDISRVMSILGKKGGKVSGSRRMENLTDKERSQIAFKAAQARWAKKKHV